MAFQEFCYLWVTCVLVIDSDKLSFTKGIFGGAVTLVCGKYCLGWIDIGLCFPGKSYAALRGERCITCGCWVRWLYGVRTGHRTQGLAFVRQTFFLLALSHPPTPSSHMNDNVYIFRFGREYYLQHHSQRHLIPVLPSLKKPSQHKVPTNLIMAFQNRIWSI